MSKRKANNPTPPTSEDIFVELGLLYEQVRVAHRNHAWKVSTVFLGIALLITGLTIMSVLMISVGSLLLIYGLFNLRVERRNLSVLTEKIRWYASSDVENLS